MAAESRKQLRLLVGLLGVLAILLWWQFGGSDPAPAARPKAAPPARAAGRGAAAAGSSTAELFARGVALPRLEEDRPAPEEGGRDPFRTGPAATAPTGGSSGETRPAPVPTVPVAPVGPTVPPGPPPPPPIAVKFIGVVSRRDIGKVAVLSDGKNVYYGREGEIVDGRWRIVAIGEESLQIEYADGRGRQTVRLTG